MKRIFQYILILELFFVSSSFSMNPPFDDKNDPYFILKIKLGGDYFFHLEDKDEEDPNIPDQFESLEQRPSVGYFFDNNYGYHFNVSGSIFLKENSPARLLLGISFEHSELMNTNWDSKKVLGEELLIDNYNPFIGFEIKPDERNHIFYFYLGPVIKFYQGKLTQNNVEWNYQYLQATSMRFAGGVEFDNFIIPSVSFGITLIFDTGTVERSNIEASQDGVKVLSGYPVGDKKLMDNTIQLKFSIGYNFDLF